MRTLRRYRIFLFTLPAILVIGMFFVYPILLSLRLSFTDFTGVGIASDVGWKNYERIFTRSRYLDAFKVTIFFTVIVVFIQTIIGLFFAALLHRLPAVRNLCRAALFTPAMMSFVIVGYVWQFIYSPFNGGLNAALASIGLDGLQHNWLGDPNTALFAVAFAHIWMFIGYTTAIFLAGYANIPSEIEEASKLEGASNWQRFRHIEVPLLASSFTINITLSTIGTLKTFELPFIMTRGGPDGATRTLSLHIIDSLFGKYKFGFASALSIIMLILVVLVAFLQNRYLRSREENT
ncbi:carbohydrate ABC transporter permease [Granulosicoccus antarcticus]|uniref:Lactose transport system permease protein LacF n=1 Tax=Granulosicoccus antarcticus IMCC3135 TaxID=1192854 RepID=A0A2Z2NQ46_9GAMM|nr:sugar ABC transporter permease [Granulosicoccus antarcticus]ASJ70910.1 Lactose transport system permease protein LacF [Granulosicoccus antarcticus IMCC3135]